MDTQHDERPIRCPMLGGTVTFRYCRGMADGLPCRNTIGCWHQELDVVEFLEANYTADELARSVGAERKSRQSRMLEAIERAKKGPDEQPEDDG